MKMPARILPAMLKLSPPNVASSSSISSISEFYDDGKGHEQCGSISLLATDLIHVHRMEGRSNTIQPVVAAVLIMCVRGMRLTEGKCTELNAEHRP